MSEYRGLTVAALPWLSAAGAAAMAGVATIRWRDLQISDRAAFGLDAAAYAAAVRPLARRQVDGWWILYLATVVQPVFGGVDIALDTGKWRSGLGRTAAAVVTAAGLLRMKRHYV